MYQDPTQMPGNGSRMDYTQPATGAEGGYNPGGYAPNGYQPGSTWPQSDYAQQGYAQGGFAPNAYPQSGFTQNGYPQSGYTPNSYESTGNYGTGGYTPYSAPAASEPQGYTPWQAPQSQPQGSYIPQTPYSPGYTSPGYQAPTGYAPANDYQPNGYQPQGGYQAPSGYQAPGGYQGYSAYQQMGYQGTQPAQPQGGFDPQHMPLNGGGYVPQPVPVRRQPFLMTDTYLILLGAGLLVLFAAALIVSGPALKIAFACAAAIAIAIFWVKPALLAQNKRMSFSIIFGVLAAVALVVAFTGGATTADPQNTAAPAASAAPTAVLGSETVVTDEGSTGTVSQETPTPGPETTSEEIINERLINFFRFWSVNAYDEMLNLCDPSWRSSVEKPNEELFGLLANRTPLELDTPFENIDGTNDDDNRTVTLTTLIQRNNGKDPARYRLNVTMVKNKDDGQWYVDPRSLRTYENAETPDPATVETPTPTPEPSVDANTTLYYNPDGGSKYHLDPNCKSIHSKYLPLKGKFPYSKINDDQYKNLQPCNVCGAPLRNQ